MLNPQGYRAPKNTETNLLTTTRKVLSLMKFCLKSVCRLVSGTSKEIGDFSLHLTSVTPLLWSTAILRGYVNVPTKTSATHLQRGIFKTP